MIFIACGSPLVTLISSLASKSDKTRKYFQIYSGHRHLGAKCECCSWWPRGHTHTLGFLHWFCSVSPFCSILSRNYYSKPLLSLNLPKKGTSSQNHSLSPFQQAFMKLKDLQPASDRGPDWTLMDPKHSSAAFLLLISFKQVNTTNNITPSQQCFPGANQAIKKA